MINTTDCAVDAQSLISISLRKIQNSRTQRGGIKLHKNLLVSYVLRNARQVYMNEKYAEIYRQQYEEVMTVCNEIQELNPLDFHEDCAELNGEFCGRGSESASLCGALPPVGLTTAQAAHTQTSVPCAAHLPLQTEEFCKESDSSLYRSCCAEAFSVSNCDFSSSNNVYCNQTTVLDLDTHVVTTVENGYLHQDCCAPLQQCAQNPTKKRKVDFGYYTSEPEEILDFTPYKRVRTEECAYWEQLDNSNISNLISIFGSGFTGLVSKQADFEHALNGQFCSKQALASLGAWTRAIVAF